MPMGGTAGRIGSSENEIRIGKCRGIPASGTLVRVQSSGLPGIHPQFRGVRPDESLERIPKDTIICDGSSTPRAVFEPGRLRTSYLCGDLNALKGFESLAEAAVAY